MPHYWLNLFRCHALSVTDPTSWNSVLDRLCDPTPSSDSFRGNYFCKLLNSLSAVEMVNYSALYKFIIDIDTHYQADIDCHIILLHIDLDTRDIWHRASGWPMPALLSMMLAEQQLMIACHTVEHWACWWPQLVVVEKFSPTKTNDNNLSRTSAAVGRGSF